MDTLKEARWLKDRDLFSARVRELGADVAVLCANSSDTQQMTDVRSLIAQAVDVLVIVAHNGAAMKEAVEEAHRAGIPVIAYDRLITGADLDLYVTFDGVKVGELQARYLVDTLGGKGAIVRISGGKTDHNAFLVKEGQDRVLAPYLKSGAMRLVHDDWADDWSPQAAKKIMNAAITRGVPFDAVLAANDGTAGGAIQALKEEGRRGVLVTGQDAELAACQRIARGEQSMTVYKPIHALAGRAAEAAVAMGKRKPIVARAAVQNGKVEVPAMLLDMATVTRDSLETTVIADGFHDREAVLGRGP